MVTAKKQSLVIKGREVDIQNLYVNAKTRVLVSRHYHLSDYDAGEILLKQNLYEANYIGFCSVSRFNISGFLVEVESNLFVVLSTNLANIIFCADSADSVSMIETPSDSVVIIDNQEYDVSKTEMSHHFIKQASERFKVDSSTVPSLFYDTVLNGRYVGITYCKEDYRPAHLYCKDGRLVYVSLDFKAAITTYRNDMRTTHIHDSVKERIEEVLLDDIKTATTEEEQLSKRNEKQYLIIDLRVAEINLEMYNTICESKKAYLQNEKNTLTQRREDLSQEWKEVVDNIRRLSIAYASFV